MTEALERLDVETARRVQAEERLHETEERFRNLSERAGKCPLRSVRNLS